MEKPVIFFSHSSKDKKYLLALKNKLLNITSNTIDIFQSSDGESIPFGNNWVHKIEENLKSSRIMFVFISPNSIKSNWIYFESGFSYAKGVKVIPIGINGIDIGQLAPPINLLQGFNITSYEGLNNLTSILNKEFSSSYKNDFTNEDYEELLSYSTGSNISNNIYNDIDFIEAEFISNLKDNSINNDLVQEIKQFLKTENIKFSTFGNDRIYLHGMIITKSASDYIIKIDQLKMNENIKIIINMLNFVYANKPDTYWMKIKFSSKINLLTTDFKLSSRLSNIGIEMHETNGNFFEYKNLWFRLEVLDKFDFKEDNEERLRIVYPTDDFDIKEVYELLEILFDNNIIYK